MPNIKKNSRPRIPSVEETDAGLEKEFAQQDPKAEDLPPKEGDSKALDESMQLSSVAAEKAEETVSEGTTIGSDGRLLHEPEGTYFPTDSHETDENAKNLRTRLSRDSEKRSENPSLLLDDLRGLGIYGELSEDQSLITVPFEDAYRLTTTMRMAEIILNERMQNKRKAKLELLKAQLNASNFNNVPALIAELEKAKAALLQKYSFQSVGMFGDEPVMNLEGIIYFETLLRGRTR